MATSATASDEVIKYIMREIAQRSTVIVKARTRQAAQAQEQSPATPVASGHSNPTQHEATLTAVTETLAAFVVRATVLDPRQQFSLDRNFDKADVERLIKGCVGRITAQGDPESETMKMQVYFDTTFPLQAEYLHKEKVARRNTILSLLRDITETRQVKTVQALEELYKKIVTYVLVKSNIGNPLDVATVREATALESVFPQTEVSTFLNLARSDKEKQLNGLTQLVSGIRLFNRNLGKSNETAAIDNLPELCEGELTEVTSLVNDEIKRTEQGISQYTAILEHGHTSRALGEPKMRTYTNQLIFRRQLLIYLDALVEQLAASKLVLKNLAEKYDSALGDLKGTIRARSAIPVDQVYPLFMSVAAVWESYQDELFVLAMRRGIADFLLADTKACPVNVAEEDLEPAQPLVREVEPRPLDDKAIIAAATLLNHDLQEVNKHMEVMHPGNSAQYYKLPVEYGGFCSVTCVTQAGLILPGDWNLGIVRYKDRLYAFSSTAAAKRFAAQPEAYLEGVLALARQLPGLVQLLQLYGYFPSIEALEQAQSFTRQTLLGQKALMCEAGAQTDLHIVDTYIDPKYEWNEWTMRRRALMLVNLRTKVTHSTQTNTSHFKRDSETQAYPQSESHTQTRRDNATSMPQRVQYIAGLRGGSVGRPPKMKVVDVTLDV
ncbi:hypothetical protein RI367_005659 [Sorochytrium milnesiophthora]